MTTEYVRYSHYQTRLDDEGRYVWEFGMEVVEEGEREEDDSSAR